MAYPAWTERSGTQLASLNERVDYQINLPITDDGETTISVIAGTMPPGLRVEDLQITGVPFEVNRTTEYEFTLRATNTTGITDRTFTIEVIGADEPKWITPEGLLNIGGRDLRNYWLYINGSNFDIFVSDGLQWTRTSVDIYEGIPSRSEGNDGDYAFNLETGQYWFKKSGIWYKMTSSALKDQLGQSTTMIVTNTTPNPSKYNFWLNTNNLINGLDLEIRNYDPESLQWIPQEYDIQFTAPLDPQDRQIWIQTYNNDFKLNFLIYIEAEGQWESLYYEFRNTAPSSQSNVFFILDNDFVDYQLEASDTDLIAGGKLEYFIADGDGELPPGLTLSSSGKISGIVEPILALDKYDIPGYDNSTFDTTPLDYRVVDNDGYDSYLFDSQYYGYYNTTRQPKKLNRYFNFTVTVADDVSESKRDFRIYVVGDDFLRADNTVMQAGTGIFTADNTYLRKPVWITPGYLGQRRANNYQTVYLDVYDPNTLLGTISYVLKDVNDDGTPSELPPGLVLDSVTGELAGIIPYQPAVTRRYRFTVEALRGESDLDIVEVAANLYEDTLAGKTTIKVNKLPRDTSDGISDLEALVSQTVTVENVPYKVESVNGDNIEYDTITFDRPLEATYQAPPLTLIENVSLNDLEWFVDYESLADPYHRAYWDNKDVIFSDSNRYKIQAIQKYIVWTIKAQGAATLEFNYDEAGITPVPGETFEDAIGRYLVTLFPGFTSWSSYKITLLDSQTVEIRVQESANTLNKNYITQAFHTSDSSEVLAYRGTVNRRYTECWRVTIDNPYQSTANIGRQFIMAVSRGTVFTQKLSVANNEIISSPKTFSIDILGEVDSTINWITDPLLPSITANRTSYLKLEATSTLEDSTLRFDLIGGRLPNGLTLKRDGEIVGKVNQFSKDGNLGLTDIDQGTTIWDSGAEYFAGDVITYADSLYICLQAHLSNILLTPSTATDYWEALTQATTFDGGTTTIDRAYKFKVLVRDRFGYSARIREFTLNVVDVDQKEYTNVYMKPFLPVSQRQVFENFINDIDIFTPNYIYRPYDENFGLQKDLKTLVYAGIEQKSIHDFAAAVAKNHKRKKFRFGDLKIAQAVQPGTTDAIYEVVYIEVVDPQEPEKGKQNKLETRIVTHEPILANQVKIEILDDNTKVEVANSSYSIGRRDNDAAPLLESGAKISIVTRNNGTISVDTFGQIELLDRNGNVVVVRPIASSGTSSTTDPFRFRPNSRVITADSNALLASQSKDLVRYISNISNMRKRISEIGADERLFLPLWMRTAQDGSIAEIDYVAAIPLCYCKPGTAQLVKENIENSEFDFKQINYEIDRYIVESTDESNSEQYLLFGNYKFNM